MFALDINTKLRATTQYDNWNFNSMVKFGNKYLGASDEGLFELSGDTDDGVRINAYFEPLSTDFGYFNPKRLRFVYLGYEAEDDLLLTVMADGGREREYPILLHKKGQQGTRVTVGADARGRYWTVRVSNIDGGDFSVDSIKVLPRITNNGHT